MVNLLSNARKFSRPGASVHVRTSALAGMANVTVEDHGIGIDPEDLAHIGERFYRAKKVRDVPGTGLGMAIVRELVELHGGEIAIESQPEVGSTISFTLPLAP
jgi:signal transduction histidine kinase